MTDDEKKELRELANKLYHAFHHDAGIEDWSNVIKVAKQLERLGKI